MSAQKLRMNDTVSSQYQCRSVYTCKPSQIVTYFTTHVFPGHECLGMKMLFIKLIKLSNTPCFASLGGSRLVEVLEELDVEGHILPSLGHLGTTSVPCGKTPKCWNLCGPSWAS